MFLGWLAELEKLQFVLNTAWVVAWFVVLLVVLLVAWFVVLLVAWFVGCLVCCISFNKVVKKIFICYFLGWNA